MKCSSVPDYLVRGWPGNTHIFFPPYFPYSPAPGKQFSTLCFYEFHLFIFFCCFVFFLESTNKGYHAVFAFLWSISLNIMSSMSIHVTNGKTPSFSGMNNIVVYVCIYVSIYVDTSSLSTPLLTDI